MKYANISNLRVLNYDNEEEKKRKIFQYNLQEFHLVVTSDPHD
jgi:hypothetical protein